MKTASKPVECATCSAAFWPKQKDRLYCSLACRPRNKRLDGTPRKKAKITAEHRENLRIAAKKRWAGRRDDKKEEAGFDMWWGSISHTIQTRDNGACLLCDTGSFSHLQLGPVIHVHHVNEDRADNRPENLVTLCAKCHQNTVHKYRRARWGSGGRTRGEWETLWKRNRTNWIAHFEILMNQPKMKADNEEIRKTFVDWGVLPYNGMKGAGI